eukprot:364664-Chlamydomonas_euryale.AAC.8
MDRACAEQARVLVAGGCRGCVSSLRRRWSRRRARRARGGGMPRADDETMSTAAHGPESFCAAVLTQSDVVHPRCVQDTSNQQRF